MELSPGTGRVLSSLSSRLAWALQLALLGAVVAVVAGAAALTRTPYEGALPAVALAGLALGALRGLAVRVVEHPEGLVVHNPLRTRHLTWSEVTALRVTPSAYASCWYVDAVVPARRRPLRLHGATCWDTAPAAHGWDRAQGPRGARWHLRTTVDTWCARHDLAAELPWPADGSAPGRAGT